MSENTHQNFLTLQDIITSDSTYKYNLPNDFFEKVLECEVNLKEKFDPKIFFDLINYYSKAIGYYESINDPKFLLYNQALNFLFEQPEAKIFMEGKDLGKEFRKKEIIKRFRQCDKLVTEEKVKMFIVRKTNGENIKTNIDNLYNKDMDKQKNSFKKNLEEKRIKYKDKYKKREIEKNENFNTEIKELKEKEKENKEVNKINENEEKVNNEDDGFKIGVGEGFLELEKMSEEDDEEISEIDFNLDDVAELVNLAKEENEKDNNEKNNKELKKDNKGIKNDDKEMKEEPESNNVRRNVIPRRTLKRTNKTRFFEKMEESFDIYFKAYYDYFINNNMDLIIKEFEDNEKEVSKKVCETGINFMNQIKDMDYLLENKDAEDSYKKEIRNISKQLENERKTNIDKILSENVEILKNIKKKYKINNKLLKEKFRLDTTKLLNSFLFK